MKIFYDGYIFTEQKYGGVNRIFIEIPDRVASIDSSVLLYLFRFPNSFKKNWILKRQYFMIPKIGGILRRMDTLSLPKIVKRFNPDIYHTTYYRIPQNLRAKKVVTVYDTIHEKFPAYFGNAERFLKRKKDSIENADKVITISESTKNDVLQYYRVAAHKVCVTYPAASSFFKEASEAEKKNLKQKYMLSKPFVLYVGQRNGYKNFITLLRAYSVWKRNKEFDLICIDGDKRWNRDESEIVDNSGLNSSVRLFVNVSDQDLRVFYSLAMVFVYPSLYEGFGIPILESMACGTSVIVANVASMPEVVGDTGLYFDPHSKEELLGALDKIAGDSTLRKELISKGLNRIKFFSWEKTALETYNVYKELL